MTHDSRRDFLKQLAAAGLGLGAAGSLAASLTPLAAGAQEDEGEKPKRYRNPVFAGSMPDPGVLLHDGVYYAFGTTGKERKADGRIFTLLRSTDLVNWTELGGALTPPDENPAYEYWAPEPAYENGTFYLYYAMGGIEEEKFAVRVATSGKPEGPYIDTGTALVDCTGNRFTIDPHPYKDVDGQWYLFYARNYPNTEGGNHPGTGLAVDRLLGMTRLAGECRTVLRARNDWTLYEAHRRMDVYNDTFDWHTIEAPYVRRHRGKYYAFYSGSNWQHDTYGVDFATSTKVEGPYTGAGKRARVLRGVKGHVRGPGHHAIVTGPDGRDWVLYHAWNEAMTVRQLCVDPLHWTAEGPHVSPSWTPQPAPGKK